MCKENIESFEELLNEFLPIELGTKEKVCGVIAQKDRNYSYLEVEGRPTVVRVKNEELENFNIGDTVDIQVIGETDDGEFLIGSRRKIVAEENWKKIQDSFENATILSGKISKAIKGGYIVDFLSHQGFLPNSLSEIPLKNAEKYVGKNINFLIKDIQNDKDKKNKKITLSVKDITLNIENEEFSKLNLKDVVTGTIKEILDFGMTIEFGALKGFIHISEVSWKKVDKIGEIYKVGDIVKAEIIELDSDKKNIKLSIKSLVENPWDIFAREHKVDDVVSAKVTKFLQYGVFAEVADGVEGLIHISDFTWNKKKVNLKDYVELNDNIQVKILEFVPEERKLKLGIRQLQNNPWDNAEEKFAVGNELSGKVIDVKPFGIFVEIEKGVDVFIHQNDFAWKGETAKKYTLGDNVAFKIIENDFEENKLKGSIKALTKSPWEIALEKYKVGQTVEKEIKGIIDAGLFVSLSSGVDGFIPTQMASKDFIKNLRDKFKIGDVVKAQITEIDKEKERIKLSIKKIEIEEERRENQELLAKYGTSSSEE